MLDRRPIYVVVAGALAVALALTFALDDDGEDVIPVVVPSVTTETPLPAVAPIVEPVAVEQIAPSFDVVRVNQDGFAVIAGRAAPEAIVVILDGTVELGRVNADGRGEWVFAPSLRLPPGQRELSLSAITAGGKSRASADVVILVIPEPASPEHALAVRMDRGGGQTKILQGDGAPEGGKTDGGKTEGGKNPTIDAVDYFAEGGITLAGRASPEALVQIYIDNALFGRVQAGADGHWTLQPILAVQVGPHTLRVDQIGQEGRVVGRSEIPFMRAKPETNSLNNFLVVQPGNSLWRIARKTYGTGFAYTDIYRTNRDRIRDPDLIYPGQIFVLPPTQ